MLAEAGTYVPAGPVCSTSTLAHPLTPTDTVVARCAGAALVCTQWADLDVGVEEVLDAPI